jgi:chorismate-pyruvate lyase
MNAPRRIDIPDLPTLLGLFSSENDLEDFEWLAGPDVPEPYHRLLVHEHHMTVTVEAHHGAPVDVRILQRRHEEDAYARRIILTLQGSDRVVLFGIVRIRLHYCSPQVREKIVAGKTPLGRILIQHNVLRRIEPTAYLRVPPTAGLMQHFTESQSRPTYGRLAIIHCDGKSAIELLEVVAPE